MIVIWQISAVQFPQFTLINGVLLAKNCPVNNTKRNLWQIFLSTIRTYFRRPAQKENIYIKIGGQEIRTQTNDAGEFWVETNLLINSRIQVFSTETDKQIPICQQYPIYYPNTSCQLAIISDIDDTILVSYTSSFLKRMKALFLVAPQNRQPISFVRSILETVHRYGGNIYYVSKSESNLFRVLTSIIHYHNIPEGNLFLTSYLRFIQLLNPKKGKNYKNSRIKTVMDNSPGKRFILLGDDTQYDMRIYTEIAEEYPDRIFRIYIRRTFKALSPKKKRYLEKLMLLPVSVRYFSDSDDVKKELSIIEDYLN